MNPSKLPQVMVATARQRGLNDVLRTMIDGIANCENVVLARIWLIGSNAHCDVCRSREATSDPVRRLHLAASNGMPRNRESDPRKTDGVRHLFDLGERKIGHVAKTGEPMLIAGIRGGEEWLADPAWIEREGVRTFAAQPLVFREEVLGVLALFDRGLLDAEALEWLRVFADYAAVSIANARAVEEIDQLQARLEKENLYLREEVTAALGVTDFIGESPVLQKVLRQVQLVAPTDAAVLITGESGTGKELVARAIHDRSERKGRALIKVNCSAIPDALFESEFFGYVKGAFTGALSSRTGRFELADHGTLFLDEIGELPLAMQAKLLRVLQERELERVGDTRTRTVDVRIIAATNRDLKQEVEAGRFRQDLFYRLSVFPIECPPLRERREDIPQLALYFVKKSAQRLKRPTPPVTQAALSQLSAHRWPGNVRELQNVVERAVILWQGGALRFHVEASDQREVAAPPAEARASSRLLTREDLKRLERESIALALEQAGGKVFGPDGAAQLLGMKATTLASRIAALGLKANTAG